MKSEFVKLNDLEGFDEEFKNSLGELEQRIFESFEKFMPLKEGGLPPTVEGEHPMYTDFKKGYGYDTGGRKYLRLVTGGNQTSVWGFIAKQDFKVINKKKSGGEFIEFKEGDILKSAGWNTPTLNASRGNIFEDNYSVNWTGPNYLRC